ncbi:hypothetical protein V1T75_08155 [Tenacibaculum sp. FZY0031]|uniref:hypothetical protein n=1 Tax=unclassified Tenacibaculum TaxID=2635139 RepID=UPI002EBB42C4|nr:hypothetical protein [Tenacibaculum sp. FZY0031]
MKKLIKFALTILSFLIIFILVDLYVFRGYFSDLYLGPFYENNLKTEEIISNDLELKIIKQKNIYEINFKNKTLKPYFIWTYRWNVYFPVNDSIFSFHYRFNANFPEHKDEFDYSVSCSTGLNTFTINPLESFQNKLNYKQIVNLVYWPYYHHQKIKNDTIMDLIHGKPLLFNNDKVMKIFERNDISKRDSINLKFYLPVFNYNNQNLIYVKSNNIKIAYKDIVENLIKSEKYIRNLKTLN